MTFLGPLWLLLIPAGALAVFLLHRRRERKTLVGSLYVWKRLSRPQSSVRSRANPRLSRSLLLQLLGLTLTCVALSEPRIGGESGVTHNIIVFDASYRMRSGGAPLEEVYRRLVANALRDWDGAAPVSIVLATDDPTILLARSHSGQALQRALGSLVATDSGPDWRATALAVRSLISTGEPTRVHVVSPLGAAAALDTMRQLLGTVELRAVPIPLEGPNVGFTSAEAMPLEMSRTFTWKVQGQVQGQESGEVLVRIEFRRLGTTSWLPWEEVALGLEAGVPKDFSVQVTVPGAGILRLVLPEDAIATDDAVYFILKDEVRRARVLIVGNVDDALVRALATVPDVLIQRADELPASSAEFDLVVADRVDLDRHPDTNTLWIGSSLHGGVAEEIAFPVRDLDWSEHVLNTGIDWRGLELDSVHAIRKLEGAQVLLQAGDVPLIQLQRHGRGIDVTWAFPISAGNASQMAAPVIFLANLLRLLVPNVGEYVGLQCTIGANCFVPPTIAGPSSPLVVPADEHVAPSGGTRGETADLKDAIEIEPVPTLPRFVPTRSGIFSVGDDGELLAVNAVPRKFVEVPAPTVTATPLEIDLPVSLRRTLLLLAIAVVLLETALAGEADLAADLRRNVLGRHLRRYLAPAALSAIALGVLLAAYLSRSAGAEARAVLLFDALAFSSGPWQPEGARSPLLSDYAVSIAQGSISGGLVAVSAGSGVVTGPWPEATVEDSERIHADGADLLAGLRIANAMAEQDTRILLATSGASTRGDLTDVFQQLQDSGVVVDTYGLDGMPPGEALIETMRVPQTVRAGQEVEALLAVYSDARQEARVLISLEGEVVEDRVLDLPAGRTEMPVTFTAPASTSLLVAALEPQTDAFETNNTFGTVLNVRQRRQILVVCADTGGPPAVVEALRSQGFEVEIRTPELAPWTMDRWLAYDSVILVDVPADRLGVPRQEQLLRYVRDTGGGLAITGGYSSFGAGGYLGTVLEEVAPVSSIFPTDAPEAALIFVVDRSGSMQQPVDASNRLELAKQAVLDAIELLPDTNLVGVIAFDSEPSVLVPLQEAGDVATVRAALQRLFPSGGTAAYPALETALDMASGLELGTIHVVLLSDGLSQPADFAGLMTKFLEAGITVSTVGIGQSANADQLRDIAKWGGGVFHLSVDLASLPSILSQEALLMSGSPIDETSFRPSIVDEETGILDDFVGNVDLGGMVLTTAKPSATVLMERDPESPLLVVWQYGLGRVLAFTSDVLPVWSAELTASTDFPRLWSQALDWMTPVVPPPGINASVERHGDDLKLLVEVTSPSGEPVPGLTVRAQFTSPSGDLDRSVDLRQERPGLYEGMVTTYEPGRYGFEVSIDPTEDLEFKPNALEYYVSYPFRYTFSAFEESLAANIARATGGKTLDEADLAEYLRAGSGSVAGLETWRLLCMAALALWFVSLAWRYGRGIWVG